MDKNLTIHWFRQDLRIADNPSLYFAARQGSVITLYIVDKQQPAMGRASEVWLHYSLKKLNRALKHKLMVCQGEPLQILTDLIKQYPVTHIHWNRCYQPWQIKRDQKIKLQLAKQGVQVKSFNASLLWEPWGVLKKDQRPYRVFTAFYKHAFSKAEIPRKSLACPPDLENYQLPLTTKIDDLNLLPKSNWYRQLISHWQPGERAAQSLLDDFLNSKLYNYKTGRDFPAFDFVSRLSPYLHFGEISPHQIWWETTSLNSSDNSQHFLSELAWREFSYYLLYHYPDIINQNLQPKFDHFPWRQNRSQLLRWQQGQTGIPIIDAGMRELWQTGYMHNRVRMISASFLVKNLRIHWQQGAAWFWDCLFDADLANNTLSWQWVAGCGADAAPYFRIFNPVLQGQKFDPEGDYIYRYVGELSKLPVKYIFAPWEAPAEVLQNAGVVLGESYPKPMVDLKQSRQEALSAYKNLTFEEDKPQ